MNTTSIIDKIDSHRLEDYITLNKVIQIRKRFGFLVKISWLIHENQFRIRPVDYKIIFQLLGYFYADLENSAHLEMNLKNGILLSGRVSYGKTSLTFLMHHFLAKETQCTMVATRDICLELFMDTISRSCICKMCFLDQKTSCPELPLEKSFASQLGGFKKKIKRHEATIQF